jgi:hypothetical protein
LSTVAPSVSPTSVASSASHSVRLNVVSGGFPTVAIISSNVIPTRTWLNVASPDRGGGRDGWSTRTATTTAASKPNTMAARRLMPEVGPAGRAGASRRPPRGPSSKRASAASAGPAGPPHSSVKSGAAAAAACGPPEPGLTRRAGPGTPRGLDPAAAPSSRHPPPTQPRVPTE